MRILFFSITVPFPATDGGRIRVLNLVLFVYLGSLLLYDLPLRRVAATISYDQVNQKMYTSSSGRWKNYEKHLGPLIDIVSDYI